MKFGTVPLETAAGSILAHSVGLPEGRLRKGVTLTPDHIAQLAETGIAEITVAQLEPGDVPEADAAARLARALVLDPDAAGVRLTPPTNGRVNIVALGPGVVELDVARLQSVNRIDPMISLATVPVMQQMHAKGLIATVKIISYAVPGAVLAQAETIGADAIRLAQPALKTAALVVSDVTGGPGIKGVDAITARLAALNVTLMDTQVVAHTEPALAAAADQAAQLADMVLILTGSATSDPFDVAPSAVRRAGGMVERFGMPVDPGNLLFVGALKGKPVVGLPGCARSPALNGADWVLSRVACGIAVTSEDIADMGVGGLLKEIPTRPMPRRNDM